jgi:Phytanoyl-CoA dioxygenase (PhyH)
MLATVRIPDEALDEVRTRGFVVVAGFLSEAEVATARDGVLHHFPPPDAYFADPAAHPALAGDDFAGLREYPFRGWDLNRLAFHPDLVDAAERLLGSTELDLYKVELWAKYAGASGYDQRLHFDYGNHTLTVPRRDGAYRHMTTILLLSDVTAADGPTALVPLDRSAEVPFTPHVQPRGAFADDEVLATGPAGTLLVYRNDVLHRGTGFGGPGRSRFVILADYKVRGASWTGKMAWPDHALAPDWSELMVRA